MKKIILLTLFTLFSFSGINAQKKRMQKLKASAESFIEKPLVVVLVNEKKEHHKLFNDYMKQAIKSEWHHNKGIEFVTEEEFKVLKKDKKSKYAYLRYYDNTLKKTNTNGLPFNEAIYFGTIEEKTSFHKELFELDKDISPVDLYVHIQRAQNTIERLSNYVYEKISMKEIKARIAEHAKDPEVLKNKTLYISKEFLKKGLEDKIDSLYDYDFEIVKTEDIETAILNNYPEFYYLTKNAVYDADTGQVIFVFNLPNSKVVVKPPELFSLFKTSKITEKDFKEISKILN